MPNHLGRFQEAVCDKQTPNQVTQLAGCSSSTCLPAFCEVTNTTLGCVAANTKYVCNVD
jgi:hypothetical protein